MNKECFGGRPAGGCFAGTIKVRDDGGCQMLEGQPIGVAAERGVIFLDQSLISSAVNDFVSAAIAQGFVDATCSIPSVA